MWQGDWLVYVELGGGRFDFRKASMREMGTYPDMNQNILRVCLMVFTHCEVQL